MTYYLPGGVIAAEINDRVARGFVLADLGNGVSTEVHAIDLVRATPLYTTTILGPTLTTLEALAVDGRTDHVFVMESGSYDSDTGALSSHGQVTVLNATTGAILRTVTVGQAPVAIAVDAPAGRVFVVNQNTKDPGYFPLGRGSVSVLDARTGTLLHTVPVGFMPASVSIDERTGHAFVVDKGPVRNSDGAPTGRGDVTTLNVRDGHVVRVAPVGTLPSGAIVDSAARRVFVVNKPPPALYSNTPIGPASVSTLDASTGRVVRTTTVGTMGELLDAAAVATPANRLYIGTGAVGANGVAGYTPSSVALLDATSGALIRTVTLPQRSKADHLRVLAVDGRAGRLVAVHGGDDGAKGGVSMLDATTGAIVGNADVGPVPTAVSIDEGTGCAYIASWGDNIEITSDGRVGALGPGIVTALDVNNGKVRGTTPVGRGPMALTLTGRSHRLLVLASDAITVLDITTPTRVRSGEQRFQQARYPRRRIQRASEA